MVVEVEKNPNTVQVYIYVTLLLRRLLSYDQNQITSPPETSHLNPNVIASQRPEQSFLPRCPNPRPP